jgi:predicted nucleic acid-binding protein
LIVVDATVLGPALVDDGSDGDRARARLLGEQLAAPELIDLEVASVLRRALQIGRLDQRRAEQALSDLADLPLSRAPHLPLLDRIWELRAEMNPYEASYVALAEALDAVLLTADIGLSRATQPRCQVELLG